MFKRFIPFLVSVAMTATLNVAATSAHAEDSADALVRKISVDVIETAKADKADRKSVG